MIEVEVEPGLRKPLDECTEEEMRAAKVALMGQVMFAKREGDDQASLAAMDRLTEVTDHLLRRYGSQPASVLGPLFEDL